MTFKQIILMLVFFLWICSCKSTRKANNVELGTYRSESFNKLELTFKRFFYDEIPSIGQELSLHGDSTFVLNTCGNVISGKFKVKPDTLILLCVKNVSVKDTTKPIFYTPPTELSYYIVDNNTLYRYDIGKVNNKNVKLSDNLERVNQ